MAHASKYDHEIIKHDPSEGFDPTEPHTQRITIFVIASVVTLAVVIFALQNYFESVWTSLVDQTVLSAPAPDLQELRNLEDWRLTHYEYTDAQKTGVRLPVERAKELFLQEAAQGKSFYPGRPTKPKPEAPAN